MAIMVATRRRRRAKLTITRKKKCFRKREKEIVWKKKKREREERIKKLREDHEKKIKKETKSMLKLPKIRVPYLSQVKEADYFDTDHVRRTHHEAMAVFKFENYDDCPVSVQLYAKLGKFHGVG